MTTRALNTWLHGAPFLIVIPYIHTHTYTHTHSHSQQIIVHIFHSNDWIYVMVAIRISLNGGRLVCMCLCCVFSSLSLHVWFLSILKHKQIIQKPLFLFIRRISLHFCSRKNVRITGWLAGWSAGLVGVHLSCIDREVRIIWIHIKKFFESKMHYIALYCTVRYGTAMHCIASSWRKMQLEWPHSKQSSYLFFFHSLFHVWFFPYIWAFIMKRVNFFSFFWSDFFSFFHLSVAVIAKKERFTILLFCCWFCFFFFNRCS